MKDVATARERLQRQLLEGERPTTALEVVQRLGALQAQDYASAICAIALRMQGGTLESVERAVAQRAIVRTWPMRGTLHIVPAEDVRWMLSLCAGRAIAASARRSAALEVDAALLSRCERIIARALEGPKLLTRSELLALLERENVATAAQRGYHLLLQLSLRGVLCFAAPAGKEPTFAMLDQWSPKQRQLDADEALATLAARYLTARSPATLHDFAWWSGLTIAQARTGFALAQPLVAQSSLVASATSSRTRRLAHLLPGFDEYLLGYKERGAVLSSAYAPRIVPGSNGIFLPTIVYDGQVLGTWRRAQAKRGLRLTLMPFEALSSAAAKAVERAAERLGEVYSLPVRVG